MSTKKPENYYTVERTIKHPEYQKFSVVIGVLNDIPLTPQFARSLLQAGLGGTSNGTVWADDFGYRLYPNSYRKVYR